jgi:hypothetical protein
MIAVSLGANHFNGFVPHVSIEVANEYERGIASAQLLQGIFQRLDLLLQYGARIVLATIAIQGRRATHTVEDIAAEIGDLLTSV